MSITDFFRGKVLLITGGTAFLGQPMVGENFDRTARCTKRFISSSEAARIRLGSASPRKSDWKVNFSPQEFSRPSVVCTAKILRHGHNRNSPLLKATSLDERLLDLAMPNTNDSRSEVQIFINVAGLVDFDPPFDDSLWGNALCR